ncbi:hypothetical protein ACFC14_18745 [Microbacterium sp. NPDC055988]|uniref:hypothetical protein n=1 Tax=Microbacterium sp. NPDC055988 TaxID=3345671 RepID=UPI0035E0C940
MSTTGPATSEVERPHISWATYEYMRHAIERLEAENAQLRANVAYWEHQTNHWYMKANYSETELETMYRRRSRIELEFTETQDTEEQQSVA